MPWSKLRGEWWQGLHDGRGLAWHRPRPAPAEPEPGAKTPASSVGVGGPSHQECRQPSEREESVKSRWLGGDAGTRAPRSHSVPGKGQASYVSSGRGLSAQLGSQGNSRMTTWPWPRLAGGGCMQTQGLRAGGHPLVPEARLAPTSQSPVIRCLGRWATVSWRQVRDGGRRCYLRPAPHTVSGLGKRARAPCTNLRSLLSSHRVNIQAPPLSHQYPCSDTPSSVP